MNEHDIAVNAAQNLARQEQAKLGKVEACDPPMGIDTPPRETPAADQTPPPDAHAPESEQRIPVTAVGSKAEAVREQARRQSELGNHSAGELLWDAANFMEQREAKERQTLPAWQDVLGDAEQVVRQKPIFAKYIKGTILENDVPVWMATFAQQAVMRDRLSRDAKPLLRVHRVEWRNEEPTYEVRKPGRGTTDDYEPGECVGIFDTRAEAEAYAAGVKVPDGANHG